MEQQRQPACLLRLFSVWICYWTAAFLGSPRFYCFHLFLNGLCLDHPIRIAAASVPAPASVFAVSIVAVLIFDHVVVVVVVVEAAGMVDVVEGYLFWFCLKLFVEQPAAVSAEEAAAVSAAVL